MAKKLLVCLLVLCTLAACSTASSATQDSSFKQTAIQGASETKIAIASETALPTSTARATTTTIPSSTPTQDPRLDPADWQDWPVIPTVSATAKEIYDRGLETGNRADHFSKIGDCQNINPYFLWMFDHPERYELREDQVYLQETIDHFSGSFERESAATKGGLNVAAVVSTSYLWVDSERCEDGESPLTCELRLHQPSIAIISMEETWGRDNKVENYEKYMRQIIETVIEFGTVPILATKADNMEGDHQINQAIARLAYEYDIPLWNFWLAVQSLEDHGVNDDGFHLTGLDNFTDIEHLEDGWPVRNLTALQSIDVVWRQLNDLPLEGMP
jgi:hypothetical protein